MADERNEENIVRTAHFIFYDSTQSKVESDSLLVYPCMMHVYLDLNKRELDFTF